MENESGTFLRSNSEQSFKFGFPAFKIVVQIDQEGVKAFFMFIPDIASVTVHLKPLSRRIFIDSEHLIKACDLVIFMGLRKKHGGFLKQVFGQFIIENHQPVIVPDAFAHNLPALHIDLCFFKNFVFCQFNIMIAFFIRQEIFDQEDLRMQYCLFPSIMCLILCFYLLISSRTSIKANPRRFSPFHSEGFMALGLVSSIPIPQMISYGLASAKT